MVLELSEQQQRVKMSVINRLAGLCDTCNTIYLKLITKIICVILVWGILYTLIKDEMVPPSGQIIALFILILASHLFGNIIELIGLPPLLGMLIAGMLIRNIGLFNINENYRKVIVIIREIALTMILTRASLAMDAASLKKFSIIVMELAIVPCIVEAIGVAICGKIIANIPWLWGLLLGFTLGAVSPAVLIPSILHLQENGYDSDKRITTIVLAASSVDDVFAISVFGVILSIIFSKGNLEMKILKCPLEILIGIASGVIWGIFSMWIPHKNDKNVVAIRIIMIGGGGILAVFGSKMLDLSGAGTLACITAAFVACTGWKSQGWSDSYNPVADMFGVICSFLESTLFGLIGTEIQINFLIQEWKLVLQSLFVLFGGLVARCIGCLAILLGGKFTMAEIVFINIAWLPKATVQAAIGSIAFDYAETPEEIANGTFVLITNVLSILITAPLGAIGIYRLGPMLLDKSVDNQSDTRF